MRAHPQPTLLCLCLAIAVMVMLPGASLGATSQGIWGEEPKGASWTCSFDAATGVLDLSSSATEPRAAELPFTLYASASAPQVSVSKCPSVGVVPLTDVTGVSIHASGSLLVATDIDSMLLKTSRFIPVDVSAPTEASVWITVARGVNQPIPASGFMVQALDSGLDVTGDGQADIRVHTPNWNVELSSYSGGTYDLRRVPALPSNGVYYRFQKAAVRVLGPTSGPDVAVTMAVGSGSDNITLYGGDDYIASAQGNDVIRSGAGNDAIFAGGGSDRIWGGTGDDWVYGAMDTRNISGSGRGYDFVWLGPGNDRAAGAWRVYGGPGRDIGASYVRGAVIDLGAGSDYLQFGVPLGQVIRCGSGIDYSMIGLVESAADRRRRLRAGCERTAGFRDSAAPFRMKWEPGYFPFDRRDANGRNITTGA